MRAPLPTPAQLGTIWRTHFEQREALWIHDGNPKRPHALLTSGKHSSGFFNGDLIIHDVDLLAKACIDLFTLLRTNHESEILNIDRVVGPAMGAINIATLMAYAMRRVCPGIKCGYVLKEGEGIRKHMTIPPRLSIKQGERILLVEDVLTTGGSTMLTKKALAECGARSMPFVLALVNRSGFQQIDGMNIISLIDHPMPKWDAIECPLCKQGSKAIHAKGE